MSRLGQVSFLLELQGLASSGEYVPGGGFTNDLKS